MNYSVENTKLSELYTYQASILHAKAYRNLKLIKHHTLKSHGLTVMQWSVLGIVNDAGVGGMRTSDIAKELDTTLAFVTTTVNFLEAKGFVTRVTHDSDKRAKMIAVAPEHIELIDSIEQDVRRQLRESIYSRVSRDDLETFMRVLVAFSGEDH